MSEVIRDDVSPISRRRAWLLLAAFYLLACGISWFAYAHAVPARSASAAQLLQDPWKLLAKFGPSLAGLAVLPFTNLGLRWLVRTPARRLPRDLALFGLGLPAAVTLVAAAFAVVALNSPVGHLASPGTLLNDAIAWISLRTFLGGGLGEEIGFRALALPLLLPLLGVRWASVLLGIGWGFWHYPALAGGGPAIWIAQLLLTVSLSIVFTHVYLRTDRSLAVMVLLHGAVNGWADFVEKSALPALDDNLAWQGGRILLYAVVAGVLLWRRAPVASSA